MNRIYQGRISEVEILTNNREKPWQPLDNWQEKIWQHHEMFQDAVNYYILALASLADPKHATDRLIKDFRARASGAWLEFPRSVGEDARSLRQSVVAWLKLSNNASIEDAFGSILNGNESSPQVRTLALALLLDRCGGESAIQQGGRGYLPRFCDANTKPTYDFSSASQAAEIGKNKLSAILHRESSENELSEITAEMDLSWTVKLQPGQFFTSEESSNRLVEAIEYIRGLLRNASAVRVKAVADQFPDFERQLDSFVTKIKSHSEKIVIPRNRKASKDLTFATLVFKFFPCSLTGKVLSLFIKRPKQAADKESKSDVDFGSCGDDPIKLARGSRGFVFRAFTALSAWNPKSPGEPVWKEFDIAAFKPLLPIRLAFAQ